ncbi:MAG: TPM domain-containing protein [Novosphingobium sp.]|uniref:TPM domain-containing protein n=1 Tax=Novosphingobium sp. TaxID=1874826 RepID=UPI001DF39C5B|nr:TPM domain-containing protein [Novosphingobium sp.]MCB2058158.1 TPM domain-containing protein [Novosphingobium sp.]MCP5386444.1 TPM domain-containing protein [Novosphingobium sp.]
MGLRALASHQRAAAAVAAALLALAALLLPGLALAQQFPALTGRVVDAANVIPADEEARLTQKLEALETQSQRQLVVVTLPDLQGYDIADYGYQLGRHWAIGDKERNDGALFIIAPNERRVRIEVGYGLEPVLTDGLSSLIIQQQVVPRFKAGDMAGGIEAGTDAIVAQLTLPEDQARKVAAEVQPRQDQVEDVLASTLFWLLMMFIFFVLPMLRRMRGGRRYHDSGLGSVILWSVLDGISRGGSSGGGGGGSSWGGGGGFSGGGGSFGGGGSSGSW